MLTDVVIANKSYTKLKVTGDYALDTLALKVIRQDCPDFLLPVKAMEIDGEMEIRYELLDGVRLAYMPREMCKKDFIEMLINMLLPFKTCNDWFLDYHNIMLDENYILIGKNGQSVKYIYLPSPQFANSDEAIKDFFTSMILKTDIMDDMGYMVNLLRIIKNPDANLMNLLDYFQQETISHTVPDAGTGARRTGESQRAGGDSVDERNGFLNSVKSEVLKPVFGERKNEAADGNGQGRQPAADKSSGAVSRPGHSTGEFGKQDEEGRLIGSLFGEAEEETEDKRAKKKKKKEKEKPPKSNGIFGIFKGKPKEEKMPETVKSGEKAGFLNRAAEEKRLVAPAPQAGYAHDYQSSQGASFADCQDETSIVDREEGNDSSILRLQLESCAGCNCPEFIEIYLQNGFATVGRMNKNGEVQSDFNFDSAVSFVSRRHFRVERMKDQWAIIDLESTNGTYLNGELLLPNMPYPLSRNDLIMISCNKRRLVYRVY